MNQISRPPRRLSDGVAVVSTAMFHSIVEAAARSIAFFVVSAAITGATAVAAR